MIEARLRDLRQAVRALRRQPGFVAAVVVTFGIAIGTNAAMFGLINRLMFAPPPGIEDAGRVVRLSVESSEPGRSYRMSTFSYPMFETLRGAGQVFSAVAAVRPDTVMTGRDDTLRPAPVLAVSGAYFAVLGATPQLGRIIGPGDDDLPLAPKPQPGSAGHEDG